MKARSTFEVNGLLKVVNLDCLCKVRRSLHFERFHVEGDESMRHGY